MGGYIQIYRTFYSLRALPTLIGEVLCRLFLLFKCDFLKRYPCLLSFPTRLSGVQSFSTSYVIGTICARPGVKSLLFSFFPRPPPAPPPPVISPRSVAHLANKFHRTFFFPYYICPPFPLSTVPPPPDNLTPGANVVNVLHASR